MAATTELTHDSTKTTIEFVDRNTIKYRPTPVSRNHAILFKIEDWAALKDKERFRTPYFNIDDHRFCLRVRPRGDNRNNQIGLSVSYDYKDRSDWTVEVRVSFIITDTIGMQYSTRPHEGYIPMTNFGCREVGFGDIPFDANKCAKINVIMELELLEVWTNKQAVVCDDSNCKRIINTPKFLPCNHIVCEHCTRRSGEYSCPCFLKGVKRCMCTACVTAGIKPVESSI